MFIKKISGRKHLLEFPNSGEGAGVKLPSPLPMVPVYTVSEDLMVEELALVQLL